MSSLIHSGRKFGISYIAVRVYGIYVLELTLTANSGSHTSQFGSGSHILYCSRIRKNVTENRQTDREQTDSESNYRSHSNPVDHWVEWANIL